MKCTKMDAIFFLISLFPLLLSCDDFSVRDISEKSIQIQSPHDDSELLNTQVLFDWNGEEGMDTYHIVIVSPSFYNIQTYAYDTLLSTNMIKLDLPPGQYQGSIQAENFGYKSLKSYVTFKVVSYEK